MVITIYIDKLFQTPSRKDTAFEVGKRHDHKWCHLYIFPVTDEGLTELHKFAQSIGLKKSWFQENKGSMPHYDLVPTKRALAVRRGAVEVTTQDAIAHFRAYRVIRGSADRIKPEETIAQFQTYGIARPLNEIERFYLDCQRISESLIGFLPKTSWERPTIEYPTPQSLPLKEGDFIPPVWRMKINYQALEPTAPIPTITNTRHYILAIPTQEGVNDLEVFVLHLAAKVVKAFFSSFDTLDS